MLFCIFLNSSNNKFLKALLENWISSMDLASMNQFFSRSVMKMWEIWRYPQEPDGGVGMTHCIYKDKENIAEKLSSGGYRNSSNEHRSKRRILLL